MKHFLLAFIATTVLAVVAVPVAAVAERSYDGDDYSEDYDSVHKVRICDRETDSNGAYVKYRPNGTTSDSRFEDANGSQAGCTGSTWFTGIYSHVACEEVNLRPDHCGIRVYP